MRRNPRSDRRTAASRRREKRCPFESQSVDHSQRQQSVRELPAAAQIHRSSAVAPELFDPLGGVVPDYLDLGVRRQIDMPREHDAMHVRVGIRPGLEAEAIAELVLCISASTLLRDSHSAIALSRSIPNGSGSDWEGTDHADLKRG